MRNVLRINRLGSVGMLVLTTLLIALGGCYALERCSRHWLGALPVPLEQRLIFDRLYLAIPCVGAALWGYLRLRMVHPALETPYRTWLRATPWSSGKPLPLGPAYLAVGDAVVAGAMSVFVYWRTGRHVLLPPVAMLFGYLATSVAVLAAVGRAEATVILFLLPGAGALYPRWPLAAG